MVGIYAIGASHQISVRFVKAVSERLKSRKDKRSRDSDY
jgi:hypothetical protein